MDDNPFQRLSYEKSASLLDKLADMLIENSTLTTDQKRWCQRVLSLAGAHSASVRAALGERDDISLIADRMADLLGAEMLGTAQNNWYVIAEKLMNSWGEEPGVSRRAAQEYLDRISD